MPKIFYVITVGALLFMTGCLSSPSPAVTYHLLHPAAVPAEETGSWDPSMYVVVGPVVLPSHLDRPQIVARRMNHTLLLNDYQRWAEPLREGIARAVAENLSRLTGAEKFFIYPFDTPKGGVSMQVFMDVVRFDTDEAGNAFFDLRWGVKNGKRQTLTTAHTTLQRKVGGADQPARVEALSRLISVFSSEVVETLRQLE
ncbi:membrane integrity-associated transporter subunit PqiC [Desulfoluna sp.]|uniref:PqiC family protein n=1 Tax=Desulfoluna sp. TaxID=2045199 RepID=UPI0026041C8B|nr:PqiC family protein [Desulfoluna sp.]